MNAPSEQWPYEDMCPSCGGHRCGACNQTGRILLTCCPHKREGMVDAIAAIKTANRWKQTKTPPAAGGLNDQTESILQACDFIWSEQARRREEHQLIDMDE